MISERKLKIIISILFLFAMICFMIGVSALAESNWEINPNYVCSGCAEKYGHTIQEGYEYNAEEGTKRHVLKCYVCGASSKQGWEPCNHEYSGNVCSICGHCYGHVYAAGVCIYCNKTCTHNWKTTSDRVVTEFCQTQGFHFHEYIDTCSICGMERNLSYIDRHSFVNGVCECGYECEHEWTEVSRTINDARCTEEMHCYAVTKICNNCHMETVVYESEAHSFEDGICTICEFECPHGLISVMSTEYKKIDNKTHKMIEYCVCFNCHKDIVEETIEEHTYVNGVCACGKPEVNFYCKYWSEDTHIAYMEDEYSSMFYYQLKTDDGYIYFDNAEEALQYVFGELDNETLKEYKEKYFKYALDYKSGIYSGPEDATIYVPEIETVEALPYVDPGQFSTKSDTDIEIELPEPDEGFYDIFK